MFTGIVTALGTVRAINPLGTGADMRLTIGAPWPDVAAIPIGASIGCSGCCLTAVEIGTDWFAADASAETLGCTTLGGWQVGTRINLERSLRLGDGVSLTVNEVTDDTFGVNIIPHTAAVTSLGALRPGDAVNLEIDMLARYVARLAEFK